MKGMKMGKDRDEDKRVFFQWQKTQGKDWETCEETTEVDR